MIVIIRSEGTDIIDKIHILKYCCCTWNPQQYQVCQKKYTKVIKHNLGLITLINAMYPFLHLTYNFEPSFVGIHQV